MHRTMTIRRVSDFHNKLCSEIDRAYFPNVKMWKNPDGSYNDTVGKVHHAIELFNNGCLSYNNLITKLAQHCKESKEKLEAIVNKYVIFEE
jgi:hypothetical protein